MGAKTKVSKQMEKYDGRTFVEGDFYDLADRQVAGVSRNKVWLYTVDKILEKDRRTGEISDSPIVRIVRWKARNDEKNKDVKYWRYVSSYNIRSSDEWYATSEIVATLIDESMERPNFIVLAKEEYKQLVGEEKKLFRKKEEIRDLKLKIRELKDMKSVKTAQLNSFKRKFDLMKLNIEEYKRVLRDFKELIEGNLTTETQVHNFLIRNKAYWLFGLEYVDIKSRVRFPPNKNYYYEFDFMLQRHDYFWDLVELKGPNENLFDQRTARRTRPNQKLSEAIGQVFTYLNLCDRLEDKNILKPRAYVVIGKERTDRPRERRIFTSYLNNVDLITYSELYKRGKRLLGYIKATSLSTISESS